MKTNILKKAFYLLLLASFSIPLVVYSFIGIYNRALADDYCDAARVIHYGVFGAAVGLYRGWTGKFTSDLVWSLIGKTRFQVIPLLPLLYIVLFSLAVFLTINRIRLSISKRDQLYLSLLLAFAIIATLLASMPNINQSLYWTAGAVSCLLPVVLFSYYCLGIVSWWRSRAAGEKGLVFLHYGLAFLMTLIAGGLNETFVVLEVVLFSMLLGCILIFTKGAHRKDLLIYFSFSLLGSLVALTLVFFAPGNAYRQANFPPAPNLFGLLLISLQGSQALMQNMLQYLSRASSLVGLLILSAMAGAWVYKHGDGNLISKSVIKLLLFIVPLLTTILVVVCFVPAAYGESAILPERAMSIPVFALVVGIAIWGFLWGFLHLQGLIEGVDPNTVVAILLVLCLVLSAASVYDNIYKPWRDAFRLKAYASQWDRMNSQILTAKQVGETLVKIDPFSDPSGSADLVPVPGSWVNNCASDFYGITIQTK